MKGTFDGRSRLRVLASAYACEPGKGSEPGVGWNWVRCISSFAQVWVLARSNNREAIEAALAREPQPNIHFVYLDLPRWAAFWKRGRRGLHAYYYLWQVLAYFWGRRLHKQVVFHLVHHVSLGKYWVPSFLALLPAPFLWGPVGGGQSTPRQLWPSLSPRGKVYELLREAARRVSELDPFLRLTARRSVLALATTKETEERLHRLGCRKVFTFAQEALEPEELSLLGKVPPRHDRGFRIVSMGNLLHLKGYHLGVRAFARFQAGHPASEYWLVGEGPERNRLRQLAARLGVAGKVKFLGSLPRDQALEQLANCDVLLHPALHDSGGWASLEAMAAGRPVVCLDLAGPALQVTEDTGVKVPALSVDQVVRDMATALHRLARDPKLRRRLGAAGRERVKEHFSWESKSGRVADIYAKVSSLPAREGGALMQSDLMQPQKPCSQPQPLSPGETGGRGAIW